MQIRTIPQRALRAALALAMVATLLASMPVQAASSIQLEARPLLGGRYEVGGWAAIAVTLINDAEPVEGFLTAETRTGVMRRFVEMPAGARKAVTLYVQPDAFQRRLTISYEEPNGTVEATVELRVLEQIGGQVAVVGDGAGNLRPQLTAIGDGRPEPLDLGLADLPERPEPINPLSGIVWAADSTQVTDAQRASLERWVSDGGDLVVLGGADWQARTAAFTNILPLTGLTAQDGVDQAELARWTGTDAPPAEAATVATGTPTEDARVLIAAEDETPLLTMRSVGAGRVLFVGPDLANEANRTWTGAGVLWSRLLPSSIALEQFWGPGFPAREETENALSQALGSVPSLEVPPAELLLAVIVGYILLIGPISYIVLRRMDRRELAWITAPVLVILFSACSYGIGSTLKGGDVIVNQISLIRTSTAGSSATVQAYAGIFSPERRSFDLSVDADALMAQMRSANFVGNNGQPTRSSVIAHQGDPARLEGLSIGVFGFEGIRAEAVVEYEPSIQVTWSQDQDGDLVGTVRNMGEETLSDVAYVSSAGGQRIGDLAPGAEETFRINRNVNGSSASDGVYGFGGFGGEGGARERVVFMRRQVIDALVGYGGFMPGMELTESSGRGPYVIGWRESPGPLAVDVDDASAQRLNHAVEIVAVRPQVLSGEVTLSPGRMVVNIVEREGDASDAGPGMVMIGDGSATYSIALPLEASGMAVSEVEIIAGPDPGFVIGEQGGFGGMWPQGFTIELRNPQTGEWTALGDLSQESRFTIDDPSTAIGDAGRIEVRVTGEGINPNFGANTVFVSAQVRGVIGE